MIAALYTGLPSSVVQNAEFSAAICGVIFYPQIPSSLDFKRPGNYGTISRGCGFQGLLAKISDFVAGSSKDGD